MIRRLFNVLFRDKNGEIVIGQKPNPLIITFTALFLVSYLFYGRSFYNLLLSISLLVLTVWAVLEVFRGANLFRRLLGAFVGAGALIVVALLLF